MTNSWVTIIVAIIGVIGTIIVTKFDEILDLFKGSTQDISGDWEVISYKIKSSNKDEKNRVWIGTYDVSIKRAGRRIKADMKAIEVEKHMGRYLYRWTGKTYGEYLMYDCRGVDKSRFMISTGLLHIHSVGERMEGYFTANSGSGRSDRTWIGYCEMKKKP